MPLTQPTGAEEREKRPEKKKGRLMPAYVPCVGRTSAGRQQHGRRKKNDVWKKIEK
jgi:hypothetical protein